MAQSFRWTTSLIENEKWHSHFHGRRIVATEMSTLPVTSKYKAVKKLQCQKWQSHFDERRSKPIKTSEFLWRTKKNK